jgi:hypothetical protein
MTDESSLRLQGLELCYERQHELVWRLPLAELRLVGERTTDHGPWIDDYFFCFVAGRPPLYYEAPISANPDILKQLSSELGQPLQCGLANRADFVSRVIWPPHLEGQALFTYARDPRAKGLLNRVKDKVLPLVRSDLTADIREYLEHESR